MPNSTSALSGECAETRIERHAALKNALLLAHDFPPESSPGAARPFRFAKYLPQFGFAAHIVASPCSMRSGENESLPQCDCVFRVPNGQPPGSGVSFTSRVAEILQRRLLPYNEALPWAAYAAAKGREIIAATPISVLLSTSPPLATHIAALWLKRRYGLKWVADFRDPVLGNPFRARKYSQPYNALLEARLIRNADSVLAVTDVTADAWRTRYPEWSHKIQVIWNGYDPESAPSAAPLPARDYKVLAHVGSLYGGRHPSALLASVDRLISRGRLNPLKVRVRLIGDMELHAPWVAKPSFLRLLNAGCLEYVNQRLPRHEAAKEMAEADYLLLLDLNDLGVGVQVPAKLFDYVLVGRPILAFTTANSPAERILAESGVAHVCLHQGSPDEQVDEQVAASFDLSTQPTRPSFWFQEQFNAVAQTRALASILESLQP